MAGVDVVQLLVSLLVLVLSLTVHEAAHAWSADRLGDPTARLLGRLSLNPAVHVDPIGTVLFPLLGALAPGVPLIGWAKPVPVDLSQFRVPRRDFALVALAGPVSNLVLALGAAGLLDVAVGLAEAGVAIPESAVTLLLGVIVMNVMLAIFNLIPIPPLDGGNVLIGLLPDRGVQLMERVRPYGFFVLYGLMLTGLLGAIVGPVRNVVLTWLL